MLKKYEMLICKLGVHEWSHQTVNTAFGKIIRSKCKVCGKVRQDSGYRL